MSSRRRVPLRDSSKTFKPSHRAHKYAIERVDNRIIFGAKANSNAHRNFMRCASDIVRLRHKDVVLDFSNVKKAYPDGMVPVICGSDWLKRTAIAVSIRLP